MTSVLCSSSEYSGSSQAVGELARPVYLSTVVYVILRWPRRVVLFLFVLVVFGSLCWPFLSWAFDKSDLYVGLGSRTGVLDCLAFQRRHPVRVVYPGQCREWNGFRRLGSLGLGSDCSRVWVRGRRGFLGILAC